MRPQPETAGAPDSRRPLNPAGTKQSPDEMTARCNSCKVLSMQPRGLRPAEKHEQQFLVASTGEQIRYEVIRSAKRRRTIAIQVRDGMVIVRAPLATRPKEVESLVNRRAGWIASILAAAPHGPAAVRNGQGLPYGGHAITLAWERWARPRHSIGFENNVLHARLGTTVAIGDEPCLVAALVQRWYGERCLDRLDASVARWAPVLGVQPGAVLVRDQRARWGSCARNGTLRFNWRLAMLEEDVLEYVVVHELAHLLQPNHSPAFWGEVSRALPGYDKHRAALKRFSAPL